MTEAPPVAETAVESAPPTDAEAKPVAMRSALIASAAAPQLVQLRVPLDDVAEVMSTPDPAGRLPIVVQPQHSLRIRNDFVIAGVITLIVGLVLNLDLVVRGTFISVAVALVV